MKENRTTEKEKGVKITTKVKGNEEAETKRTRDARRVKKKKKEKLHKKVSGEKEAGKEQGETKTAL